MDDPYVTVADYRFLKSPLFGFSGPNLTVDFNWTHNTHQEDLDGTEDVHGPGERGAQIEAQSHSTSKLRAQRPRDHVVGASSWENIIKHHYSKRDTGRQALDGKKGSVLPGNHWHSYKKHHNQPCSLSV